MQHLNSYFQVFSRLRFEGLGRGDSSFLTTQCRSRLPIRITWNELSSLITCFGWSQSWSWEYMCTKMAWSVVFRSWQPCKWHVVVHQNGSSQLPCPESPQRQAYILRASIMLEIIDHAPSSTLAIHFRVRRVDWWAGPKWRCCKLVCWWWCCSWGSVKMWRLRASDRVIVGRGGRCWRACRQRKRMCSRMQHVARCCRATSPLPLQRLASARQPWAPPSHPPAQTCSTPSGSPRNATYPSDLEQSATVRRCLQLP